ncbi:pyruvate dehydrogenase (acetyl-transferring) E1 component subunit alpha [Isoptericola hypogeus]|uniref:Pyruvate dehydrogenase (Acetyl-transferring) E1 component subunit alpha n=1 Tax=Isoptericola hypogeus TaxID=300179 RepID=A0ABN2J9E5_9MICO
MPHQAPGGTDVAPADVTPLVQLVSPTGERVVEPDNATYRSRVDHLTPGDLRAMYRDMVLTRRFDDEATALQRQGELALYAQGRGQEAAQVGSAWALAPQDYVFPSYREHGVLHVRGVDPVDRLRLYRGEDHGGWDPAESNVHLYTLVIGSHVLHATGYAMGVQRDGAVGTGDASRDAAVVTYFGDGATSQGDVSEALVFAAVNNAPTVFFCQNNQWAISEPTTRQSRVPLYRRGEGFGIPSVRVDGNDVLACYAVTAEALERAHAGGGPTFIEAYTYRMGAHTTSDDPTRYRERAEEEYWRQRDPIERVAALLRAEDAWDDAWAAQIDRDADALGERLRTEVRALGAPPATTMFEHVYATEHAQVTAERAWFEAYENETGQSSTEAAR